jgi:hypothetical protein
MSRSTRPQRIKGYQMLPENMLAYAENSVSHHTTIPHTMTKIHKVCNFINDNG